MIFYVFSFPMITRRTANLTAPNIRRHEKKKKKRIEKISNEKKEKNKIQITVEKPKKSVQH